MWFLANEARISGVRAIIIIVAVITRSVLVTPISTTIIATILIRIISSISEKCLLILLYFVFVYNNRRFELI
jgi:hypothetical protein